jgi:WD40 repeat protein
MLSNKVWFGYSTGNVVSNNLTWLSFKNVSTFSASGASVNSLVRLNSNQVASGSSDNLLKVWNTDTNTLVNTYYGHTAAIQSLAILPGSYLASGSSDSFVIIWNLASQTASYVNIGGSVNFLKVHAIAGTLLVNTPNNIMIYDGPDMNRLGMISCSGTTYNSLEVLLPSGNVLGVAANKFDIYNYPSGTVNFTTTSFTGITLNKVKLLPDNVTVVASQSNGVLALFNSITNSVGTSVTSHSATITVLEITPDGLNLISASTDLSIVMWQWATMSLIQSCKFTVPYQPSSAALMPATFTGGSLIINYFLNSNQRFYSILI